MKPRFALFLLGLLAPSIVVPGFSQTTSGLSKAVEQLLDSPAPAPVLKEVAEALTASDKWSSKPFDPNLAEPGDDAPAKVLIDYWDRQVQYETNRQPSEKPRERLLEAVLEEPRFYSRVLELLPDTAQAHDRIKHFLDELDRGDVNHPRDYYTAQARELLRTWLSRHSQHYRDLLIQRARKVSEDDRGHFDGDANLEALAKLDWQTAKPIIDVYLSYSSSVSAYALALLYAHCEEPARIEELRERLKSLASDKTSLAQSRKFAVDALLQTDWPGRDPWFLSLFDAASSPGKRYGGELDFLTGPVKGDPDHWIPILTGLVGNSNPKIHNAAVFCLAQFIQGRARADALRPLLPWLSNPRWSSAGSEYTRARVIDAMALVELPESVTGLLAIVENERGFQRSNAAEALATIRDRRAIPTLRRAIEKAASDDGYSAGKMITALIACGGLSDAEKVGAIETVAGETKARETFSRYGSFYISDAKSVQGRIGQILALQKDTPESVAAGVVRRYKELRNTKPNVAETLWLIALQWKAAAVDIAIAERIAEGSADLNTLRVGLERRKSLQANAAAILRPLLSLGGYAAGISAAVLGDVGGQASILGSKDSEARIALLACARMVRDSLPFDSVGKLLSQGGLLQLAAERYLESTDTSGARKLLRSQRPGEILIQGARDVFNPKERSLEDWVKWESALVDDVKNKRADEVFGELQFHYSDATPFITRQSAEIRVRADEAQLCKRKDAAREECRLLQLSELQSLRGLFEEVSFDDLPPIVLPGGGLGGSAQEFVRIMKDGGRRVFAANLYLLNWTTTWSLKNQTPHNRLASLFGVLEKTGDFALRYALKEKIANVEVLSADDQHPVEYVSAEGGELRVLVKDKEANWEAIRKGQKDDSLNWHALSDGKIGAVTTQPQASEVLDDKEDLPDAIRQRFRRENPLWQIKAGDTFIRITNWNGQQGIWLCRVGSEPKPIAKGNYFNPIVTPDGNWLVAVKRGSGKDGLVRIDLRTNREFTVETENFYYPVVRIPGSEKLLFGHYRGDAREHSMLDPATGAIEVIKGECEPIEHQYARPLQPISGSQEYWAAIPDFKSTTTRVGRYDARAFKFTSIIELPGIGFTSQNMWVDESGDRLYIAYNGHLLRLPFAAKGK